MRLNSPKPAMLKENLEEDSEVIEIKIKKRTIKIKDSTEKCQIRRNKGNRNKIRASKM